jgi:hypothetical protein
LVKAEKVLDERIRIRNASLLSRILWKWWDWSSAFETRRSNYRYLLEQWPSKELRPLFNHIPDSVCPLGFAVRSEDRDRLQGYLISKRIYVPVHWQRPAEISRDDFPEQTRLANEELTIPIDQRYSRNEMDYILEVVCNA